MATEFYQQELKFRSQDMVPLFIILQIIKFLWNTMKAARNTQYTLEKIMFIKKLFGNQESESFYQRDLRQSGSRKRMTTSLFRVWKKGGRNVPYLCTPE